ncbi:MAG: DUF6531 domain-containing protein, partial [Fimbriimonadaceae bacterium]|nr:DUF6531 domain-containing protein [Fimbriimonadaceae bacterium]
MSCFSTCSSRFLKPVCTFVAVLTFVSASPIAFSAGLKTTVETTQKFIALRSAKEFSERPGKPFLGDKPGRDEERKGWFTPRLRADLESARLGWAIDSAVQRGELLTNAFPTFAGLVLESVSGSGGEGELPGEAGENGGGSQQGGGGVGVGLGLAGETNTNTGNNLLTLDVVSIPSRGESGIDFTLYYNSRTSYNDVFGKKWSHSYDARIFHTPGSSAQVRMPDGLVAPYQQAGSFFIKPAGWNHTLVRHSGGTWTKTWHNQDVWEFNAAGRLVQVKDRYGNTTTINRNSSGNVTSVQAADGRQITLDYNSDGRVWRITDPASRVWTFNYDAGARLTGVAFPQLNGSIPTRQFTYNSSDFLTSEQDLRTYLWHWTYDSQGRLLTQTNPRGHAVTYSYSGSATTLTLPGGQQTIHNYSSGLLVSAVDGGGFSESYLYNSNRDVTQVTDKRGGVWQGTHDLNGNLLTRTNPLGKVWTYTYNSKNDLTSEKTPLNHTTNYTYDSLNRLTKITDPL